MYFAGDTDLFEEMARPRAGLDVAILPVARLGPAGCRRGTWTRAVRPGARAPPLTAVPMHWGTYGIVLRGVRGDRTPAEQFAREAAAVAPDVEVRILSEGGSLELDA